MAGLGGVVVGGGAALDAARGRGAPGMGSVAAEVAGGEDAVEGGRRKNERGVAGLPRGDGRAVGHRGAEPEVEVVAGQRAEGGVVGEFGGLGIDVGVAEDEGRRGVGLVLEGFREGVGRDQVQGDGALGLVDGRLAEVGLEVDGVDEQAGAVAGAEFGAEGAAGGASGEVEAGEGQLPHAVGADAGEEREVEFFGGAVAGGQVRDVGPREGFRKLGVEFAEGAGVLDFLQDQDVGVGFGDDGGGAAGLREEGVAGAVGAVEAPVGEVLDVVGRDAQPRGAGGVGAPPPRLRSLLGRPQFGHAHARHRPREEPQAREERGEEEEMEDAGGAGHGGEGWGPGAGGAWESRFLDI